MSPTEKIDLIVNELDHLIDSVTADTETLSYDDVLTKSKLIDVCKNVLIMPNGAVVPAIASLLKKRGFSIITIKQSDVTGNMIVYIDAAGLKICIYSDSSLLEIVDGFFPTAQTQVPAPVGFFTNLKQRIFG